MKYSHMFKKMVPYYISKFIISYYEHFSSRESFKIILGILFKTGTIFYDHLPLLNSIDSNASKDFYIILCISSSCLVTFM